MSTRLDDLPVVVIGAGPVGLAAAAHLAERGIAFTGAGGRRRPGRRRAAVGPRAAVLAVAVQHRRGRPPAARRGRLGRTRTRTCCRPAASSPTTTCNRWPTCPRSSRTSATDARVVAVTRLGLDRVRTAGREDTPFLVRLAGGDDVLARAVIDASGTWSTPNVLGAVRHPGPRRGRPRPRSSSTRCPTCSAPTATGSPASAPSSSAPGHSAANTLLSLAELAGQAPGTRCVWAIRATSPARTYGGEAADALPARGALGTRLRAHVEAGTIELVTGFCGAGLTVHTDGRVERVRRRARR